MVEMEEGAAFVAAVAVKACQTKSPIHYLYDCRWCRAVLRHSYCRLQLLGMRGGDVVRKEVPQHWLLRLPSSHTLVREPVSFWQRAQLLLRSCTAPDCREITRSAKGHDQKKNGSTLS